MKNRFFFVMGIFGVLAVAAVPAVAEDVKISSTYPLRYGEYAQAESSEAVSLGSPESGALSQFYGNVTVQGDLRIHKDANTLVRVAPLRGPYGQDGMRVHPGGQVSIGANYLFNASALTLNDPPPRFKAHTVMVGQHLYAVGGAGATVYSLAHAYLDATALDPNLKHRAQFCARPVGVDGTDPAVGVYAPLKLDAKFLQFGLSYAEQANVLPGGEPYNGVTDSVLIGVMTPYTPGVNDARVALQVGDPLAPPPPNERKAAINNAGAGGGWRIYSSREYKKDIAPLTPLECGRILQRLSEQPVVRYRYRAESPDAKPHLGLIAEDLPEEIRAQDAKTLDLSEAYAYAAAALKALKSRNDDLKARLEKLEATKRGVSR